MARRSLSASKQLLCDTVPSGAEGMEKGFKRGQDPLLSAALWCFCYKLPQARSVRTILAAWTYTDRNPEAFQAQERTGIWAALITGAGEEGDMIVEAWAEVGGEEDAVEWGKSKSFLLLSNSVSPLGFEMERRDWKVDIPSCASMESISVAALLYSMEMLSEGE